MRRRALSVAASAFAFALTAAPALAAAVPGLSSSTAFLAPDTRDLPTARDCAAAWNAQAPQATRAWVAARKVAKATISVAVGAGGAANAPGALCVLTFDLGAGKVLPAVGLWSDGGVPRWQGSVQELARASLEPFREHLNGGVRRDGSVSCAYLCDETVKLPVAPVVPPAVKNALLSDVCGLVRAADVGLLFGHTPKHRTSAGSAEIRSCIWHDTPLASTAPLPLVVQTAEMSRARFARLAAKNGYRRLAGVGGEAFANASGNRVTAWRAGRALAISSYLAGAQPHVKRMARTALARLP